MDGLNEGANLEQGRRRARVVGDADPTDWVRETLGDARLLPLVLDLNPGLSPRLLASGATVLLPTKQEAQRFAARMGFHIGLRPEVGGSTDAKRRWSRMLGANPRVSSDASRDDAVAARARRNLRALAELFERSAGPAGLMAMADAAEHSPAALRQALRNALVDETMINEFFGVAGEVSSIARRARQLAIQAPAARERSLRDLPAREADRVKGALAALEAGEVPGSGPFLAALGAIGVLEAGQHLGRIACTLRALLDRLHKAPLEVVAALAEARAVPADRPWPLALQLLERFHGSGSLAPARMVPLAGLGGLTAAAGSDVARCRVLAVGEIGRARVEQARNEAIAARLLAVSEVLGEPRVRGELERRWLLPRGVHPSREAVVAEVRRVLADVGRRAERKTRSVACELEQTLGGHVDELCPDVPGGAMLRSLSARGLALVVVATMLEQDDPRTLLEAGARRRFRAAVGERAATVIPGAIRAVGAAGRTEIPSRVALRA